MGCGVCLVFNGTLRKDLITGMSEIREYASKQLKTALRLLKQYNSASNEEVLHQLRVSLKKLKAVLVYLRTLHHKKVKSLRNKLQLVFHAAGSLREAQLRLRWLKESEFIFLIQHNETDQKAGVEEELFIEQTDNNYKKLKSIGEKLSKQLKEVKEDDIFQYAIKLKSQIAEQVKNIEKQDWHELRRLIKQLLYGWHWITKSHQPKLLTVVEYKKLDGLQERIGDWNDAVDLLQWLTGGQFFLSKDSLVELQFNKAFEIAKNNIAVQEKIVLQLLQTIKITERCV
jgi:CHAD domain-containing protein